ncbi:MAG TPA: FAD-dependent thymidylate synthase, partial [Myxococcales bacterium]|nr:FAD-dependent thymidylate synthase [Myxococcales bacterium]
MDVVLIDIANDPLTKLYGAYRTCYTPKTPREVWDEIAAGTVTREKIAQFVEERLKTGHVSPLEQVVFWFGISGVSRSLSHQFVRHRIGISFEQQSQRYVRFTGKNEERLEYVMPESWRDAGRAAEFEKLMSEITRVYRDAVAAGIPAEDARFVLPNAAPTNFQIMVNFAELLHIGDLRLCTR